MREIRCQLPRQQFLHELVQYYSAQGTGPNNNCLNPGVALAGADIDRCAIEQLSIDIRQTGAVPLDPWVLLIDAFELRHKDRGRLIVCRGSQ
jgi:hypothetical protein